VPIARPVAINNVMGIGREIIDELAKRRQLGRHFDFAGYQRLRRVSTPADLQGFLLANTYQSPPVLSNAVEAVDYLQAVDDKMSDSESRCIAAAIALGVFVPLLDMAVYLGALVLWLARPWRKHL
jgi:hypothetical protein